MTKKRTVLAVLLAALVLCVVAPALAAWPVTPLTTYVSGTTPYIKAFDLNAIQDAINRAFLGTYSYKAIQIDGTGGGLAAPPAGSLIVSRSTAGAPGASSAQGELTKGLVPQCWAKVTDLGVLQKGVNVQSVTKTATGTFRVLCFSTPTDPALTAPMATLLNPIAPRQIAAATQDDGTGHLRINVVIRNPANVIAGTAQLADEAFQVVVFAE